MEIYILYTDPEAQRVHEFILYSTGGGGSSLWQVSVEAQSQVAVIQDEEVVVVSFCIHCSVLNCAAHKLAEDLPIS